MIFLPDTNACVTLLRQRDRRLIARWRPTRASDIVLCSIVVYELRHGAERSSHPAKEHAKLDLFLQQFASLAFDDACAARCAGIRRELERSGTPIGPHDLQIAAVAQEHDLTLVTHNTRELPVPLFRPALPTVARRRSQLFGCAALCMFGANQEAKSVSIMRTRSKQIGVQPATIDVQLDGQIGS
jgi:tRNA(fMet)-specific endonuclease VapC